MGSFLKYIPTCNTNTDRLSLSVIGMMWLLQQANRNPPPFHPPPPPTPLPYPSPAHSFYRLRANFGWSRSAAGGVWKVCRYIGDDQHLAWSWAETACPGTPHTIHGGDEIRSWSLCMTVIMCVWCWIAVDLELVLGPGTKTTVILYWKWYMHWRKRSRNEIMYSFMLSVSFISRLTVCFFLSSSSLPPPILLSLSFLLLHM